MYRGGPNSETTRTRTRTEKLVQLLPWSCNLSNSSKMVSKLPDSVFIKSSLFSV